MKHSEIKPTNAGALLNQIILPSIQSMDEYQDLKRIVDSISNNYLVNLRKEFPL